MDYSIPGQSSLAKYLHKREMYDNIGHKVG